MDSIIFDLDGTLWDSRESVLVAWNQVVKKHKEIKKTLTTEDFKQTMGLNYKEIGKKLFPELSYEQQDQLLKDCCEVECDILKQQGGTLYNEVETVLHTLTQKYKLFIVSNCQDGYIEAFYEYHKLGKYFKDYENPGRTGLTKGENIKLIIHRNHLTSPVYVGDTDGDQKAAAFAEIPFVYARYGFGQAFDWDFVIDVFGDLLRLFN